MFSYLAKKLRFLQNGGFEQKKKLKDEENRREEEESGEEESGADGPDGGKADNAKLDKDLESNIQTFKRIFGGSGDFVIREFAFGSDDAGKGVILYIDGLVSSLLITESILRPVLDYAKHAGKFSENTLNEIKDNAICSNQVDDSAYFAELAKGCADGDTVFLFDGFDKGLIINTKGWDKRSVTEPQSETVVRGPREGFTENLRTNTALLRRRIKTPMLRLEQYLIGRQTKTTVCIAYIEGIAKPDVVKKLKFRLSKIDVDSVIDSGYIEQYIEDAPFSIFPTVGYTEKPDVAAAKILEGRIGIVVDGSPFVLTVPMLFIEGFQSAEDYYVRTIYASTLRLLRYIAFFLTIMSPAVYIALTTYHQELIPTTLLFTIAGAREGTPFPAFIEAIIMVFAFEILKEAGLRLPRHVGQAISIVGALVMGQAAVSAGIVGAPMVITIAITAVSGFVVPNLNEPASILRLLFMMGAAFMGGYGITLCLLAMLVYLGGLQSFGVEFFRGLQISKESMDSYVRFPLWYMEKRPSDTAAGNMKRRIFIIPPARPHKGN